MQRLYFLIFTLGILIFATSAYGNNATYTLYQKSNETIITATITYFTNFRGLSSDSPSYEKSLCPQNGNRHLIGFDDYSQRDTIKKKLTQLDKGLVQKQRQTSNEIDGLLLNATISPAGYDFYVDFSHNWNAPINAQGYTIVVKEYLGRGTNIILAIEVNNKQLVYRQLRPVYSTIHQLATSAANYISGYLSKGNHLRGVDADGNFIDVQATNETRKIKTPFDVY